MTTGSGWRCAATVRGAADAGSDAGVVAVGGTVGSTGGLAVKTAGRGVAALVFLAAALAPRLPIAAGDGAVLTGAPPSNAGSTNSGANRVGVAELCA